MSARVLAGLLVVLLLACNGARAETRAWLDRDRIVLGESATLNIETDQAGVPAPDYGVLDRDFRLSGHASRRSVERGSGGTVQRSLFAVALTPTREGVIGIPALDVGGERTQPLTLTVLPPSAAGPPAGAGDTVFIEVRVDDGAPYVQQAVGVVVRLHYAVPLVSGNLEVPTPDGATLRRVGDDLQYTRALAGRRYSVLERRYLLIPERSGTLQLPPARFEGRGVGGFFDDLFGDGRGDALRARGEAVTLRVQPVPAGAPQPWRPLHGLDLRYLEAPREARAGEAATVVVEARIDGAGAAAAPALSLSAGTGAQVFAEPAQVDEALVDGRPQATITQRFSIVPGQPGTLQVRGPDLAWWDVGEDVPRSATLPPVTLEVAPGDGAFASPPSGVAATGGPPQAVPAQGDGWRVPGVQGEARPWAVVAVGFALLWLLTLAWALGRRGEPAPKAPGATRIGAPAARLPAGALRRALDGGDPSEILDALHALAPAPTAGVVAALRAQLDEAGQRDALDALEAARWGDGDPVAARAAMRAAFARGPRWGRPGDAGEDEQVLLAPLYPGPRPPRR